ncbi:uncharacterized protein [Salminus brasiliensis]|uniref:uncharacterized protein n=1 Tax=Salminus brasiliensis TaxID=930266 RepID=UPI003B8322D8
MHLPLLLTCLVFLGLLFTAGDDAVTLLELEGNTVTICTGFTGVQSDAQILWLYGPKKIKIVNSQVFRGETITDYNRDRFRDRLQLDRSSGSLTIRNISREDSGEYRLQIITETSSVWKFTLKNYAQVSKPVITSQPENHLESPSESCSPVCSVENGEDVTLTWSEEKERISSISRSDSSERLHLPLNRTFPNIYTYTCESANPVSHQTTQLNITELCDINSGEVERNVIISLPLILTLVLTGLVSVALILLCLWKRNRCQKTQGLGMPLVQRRFTNAELKFSVWLSLQFDDPQRVLLLETHFNDKCEQNPIKVDPDTNQILMMRVRAPEQLGSTVTPEHLEEMDSSRRSVLCFLILTTDLLFTAGQEAVILQELEGNTVTILTGLTGVKSDAQILWFYTSGITDIKILNSQIFKGEMTTDYISDKFRDRLQLDRSSGSLTIKNISREDSGVYKLQIITGTSSDWSFRVKIYGMVPYPFITRNPVHDPSASGSRCSVLCSADHQRETILSWFKGRELLSQVSDNSSKPTLPLEVNDEEQDIYSCVAANPVSNLTTKLNFTEICSHEAGDFEFCGLVECVSRMVISVVVAVALIVLLTDHCKTTLKGSNT